ncbi:MAG: hypothetical protein HY957_04265 [Nitrospirae bacterium]|nr:hypothetical protein [Nitrospirota bacterium]
MDRKDEAKHSIGKITIGIREDTLVLEIVAFIRQQLPSWRDDPDRAQEQAENRLNLQLCKFLDSRARDEFPMVRFDHEEYQGGRRSVDLSASLAEPTMIDARVHTIYDPILVIEGKRLPAPSSDREKEYVTGGEDETSGGIQRFKLGLHGASLNTVAMVGYIQKQTARHWYNQVNTWISELVGGTNQDSCTWNETEKLMLLEEDVQKGISSSRSVHIRSNRVSSRKIMIHHLWIAIYYKQKRV